MDAALHSVRSLAARTVHVKIYPTARTFSERREVLRVLERFGEVTMFRSLKYHPRTPVQNAFISIFSTESAAQEIMNTSPIRYRLVSEPSPPTELPVGPPIGPLQPAVEGLPIVETSQEANSKQEPQEKVFELNISHSDFDHQRYIQSPTTNPLHGPYRPFPPKQSYIGGALDKMIPDSLWAAGLRDWETDGLKRRSVMDLGLDIEGKTAGENAQKFVEQREMRRKKRAIPGIMWGLKAFQEGKHEKGDKANASPTTLDRESNTAAISHRW